MKKTVLVLSILIFLFLGSFAQEAEKSSFSIDGQFRTRGEYRDGYKKLLSTDDQPSILIAQRSRLKVEFKKSKFETRFSVQDVRAWGESREVNTTKNILLHEGWVKYNFTEKLAVKVGRVELSYDDKRVIRSKNWNNYGSSHDVALFTLRHNKLELDLGISYGNNNDKAYSKTTYYVPNAYKSMGLIRGSYKFNDNIKINFMNHALGYEKEGSVDTTYYNNTAGLNPIFKFGDFKIVGSGYYQTGESKVGLELQSYMYAAKAEYKGAKYKIGAGYSSYSGKAYNDTDSLIDKQFFSWMGLPHFVMGNMDYLTGGQINTDFGVNDISADFKYGKATSVQTVLHLISYSNSPGENVSKEIGTEIDLIFAHKLSKEASIKFMYSVMLPSTDFKTAALGTANQRFSNWACLILTYKPTFFKN